AGHAKGHRNNPTVVRRRCECPHELVGLDQVTDWLCIPRVAGEVRVAVVAMPVRQIGRQEFPQRADSRESLLDISDLPDVGHASPGLRRDSTAADTCAGVQYESG